MANGVPVKYHSISFFDKGDEEAFQLKLATAAPGETITLDKPPDMVNVELFPDFDGDDAATKARNKKCRQNWKFGTISDAKDNTIVIPISISNRKHLQFKATRIKGFRGITGSRIKPSRVELADYFPIEPGFSVTIHKAQVQQSDFYFSATCSFTVFFEFLYTNAYTSVVLII